MRQRNQFKIWLLSFLILSSCGYSVNRYGFSTNVPLGKNVEQTAIKLEKTYINPKQLKPKILFENAILSLEEWFDEMEHAVTADQKVIIIRVLGHRKAFPFPSSMEYSQGSIWKVGKTLSAILYFLKQHLRSPNPFYFHQGEHAAIDGLFSSLDPHTSREGYNSEPARNRSLFREDYQDKINYPSLGLIARQKEDSFAIVQVIPESPAEKAGLHKGDQILTIESYETKNMLPTESEFLVKNTNKKVTLCVKSTLEKNSRCSILEKDPTQEDFAAPLVFHSLNTFNQKKIAYFHIKDFSSLFAFSQFQSHFKNALTQGAQGLVLDLRDNMGGITFVAEAILNLLQKSSQTVHLLHPSYRVTLNAPISYADQRFSVLPGPIQNTTTQQLPMVVIINQKSASSAELLAGGLKNTNRAVILGIPSFGKGSVFIQSRQLDGTLVDITNMEYLLPYQQSIQLVGIMPDILMTPAFLSSTNNLSLHPEATFRREKDLKGAFSSIFERPQENPAFSIRYLPPLQPEPKQESSFFSCDTHPQNCDQDDVAKLAFEMVSRTSHMTRTGMLKELHLFLQTYQEQANQAVLARLQQFGLDFHPIQKTTSTSQLTEPLEVTILQQPSQKSIIAGQEYPIRIQIKNTGSSAVGQVRAQIQSDTLFLHGREVLFGKILPLEMVTKEISIKIPSRLWDKAHFFTVQVFTENQQHSLKIGPFSFAVKALPRPQFSYQYQLIHETKNQDGKQRMRLKISLKNPGIIPAKNVQIALENLNTKGVLVSKGFFQIGPLNVGEEKSQEFEFWVDSHYKEQQVSFRLLIGETGFPDEISTRRIRIPRYLLKDFNLLQKKGSDFPQGLPIKFIIDQTPLTTSATSLPIKAQIEHPERLYDVSIFIGTENQNHSRKFLYQRLFKPKALIELEIPLQLGENLITIQVRADPYDYFRKVINIYRTEK